VIHIIKNLDLLGYLKRIDETFNSEAKPRLLEDGSIDTFWRSIFRLARIHAETLPDEIVFMFVFKQAERLASQGAITDKDWSKLLGLVRQYHATIAKNVLNRHVVAMKKHLTKENVLDYEKARIRIVVDDMAEIMRLSPTRKEPWTADWIEGFVKEGDVFYDIGANVGAYALIAAAVTKGKARIFAFEPSFATFSALNRNVILNGYEEAVTCLPFALWSDTKLDVFNYRDIQSGAALHSVGKMPFGKGGESEPASRMKIAVFRLDDVIKQCGLPPPSHIKIDVDGGERHVLEGAAETLANPSLRSVMIEVSQTDPENDAGIREIFARNGFVVGSEISKESADQMASLAYVLFERRRNGDQSAAGR
jgi:FkbM family methyltransferase